MSIETSLQALEFAINRNEARHQEEKLALIEKIANMVDKSFQGWAGNDPLVEEWGERLVDAIIELKDEI